MEGWGRGGVKVGGRSRLRKEGTGGSSGGRRGLTWRRKGV